MFLEARGIVFIGDIHGRAPTLRARLEQFGWSQRHRRLAVPADHKLVFVRDLIDRGPQNQRTVKIVHDLVEPGDALCLMGKHDFNAVQFHTTGPEKPGERLRPQSEKSRKQHRAVLEEIERRPSDWADILTCFRTLPLAVEGENWRCVHACWNPSRLELLQHGQGRWFQLERAWELSARRGTREYRAVETVLKGPEARLPDGTTFGDKAGTKRDRARIRR